MTGIQHKKRDTRGRFLLGVLAPWRFNSRSWFSLASSASFPLEAAPLTGSSAVRGWVVGFWLAALAAAPALAQPALEIPYVPTPQIVVDEMLRLASVGPRDVVMDLGSGDGRIVITAAQKFGARGIGVELDDQLLIVSEEYARRAGVRDRVTFLEQDLFKADLSQATVITLYLLPSVMRKLKPRLLELKPGTRIVAHDFDFEDWKPDHKTTIRKNVMLWIVPAKAAGRWQARLPIPPIERQLEIAFTQRYQEITASARLNGVQAQVWDAALSGDRLRFVIVDSTDPDNEANLYFEGRVIGNTIEGEVARGVGAARATYRWRAIRTSP